MAQRLAHIAPNDRSHVTFVADAVLAYYLAAMPHGRRRTLNRVALAALFAFMGFVVWRTFHLQGVRCEVCITYNGLSQCRTVEGEREEDAHQAAVGNVCAYLASGVTDGMACARTPPTKSVCTPIN